MELPSAIACGLLLVSLFGGALLEDCGPCACTEDTPHLVTVNCSTRGLTHIPGDLPRATSYLDFSGNRLAPEQLNELCKYALIDVNLTGNHLTSLSSNQFERCYITGQIDFTGNLFETISGMALSGLRDVKYVLNLESRYFHPQALSQMTDLRGLAIILHQSTLSSGLFEGLGSVHTLMVDIRNAFEMPKDIFRPMSQSLRRLKFVTKSFPSIDEDILKGCSMLNTFELFARNIHSIPSWLFNSTPSLTSVNMRGVASLPRHVFANLDKLTALEIHGAEDLSSDVFVGLLQLKQLDLSECSIPELTNGWFQDLWSLEKLSLANVGLQTLGSDDFAGLSAVIDIDLSGNDIRTMDTFVFNSMNNTLKYITLAGNSIKMISGDTFTRLAHLEILDLGSNQIHSIAADAFNSLHDLQELNMHDNKIYLLPQGLFDQNYELEVLDLSSNVISDSLPKVFERLHSLRVLNISDNLLTSVGFLENTLYPFIKKVDLSLNQLKCECASQSFEDVLEIIEVIGTCLYGPYKLKRDFKTFIMSDECDPTTTSLPPPSTTTPGIRESPSTQDEQIDLDTSGDVITEDGQGSVDHMIQPSDSSTPDIQLMPSFTTPVSYDTARFSSTGQDVADKTGNTFVSTTPYIDTTPSIDSTFLLPSSDSRISASKAILSSSTVSAIGDNDTQSSLSRSIEATDSSVTPPSSVKPTNQITALPPSEKPTNQSATLPSTEKPINKTSTLPDFDDIIIRKTGPGASEEVLSFAKVETSEESYYVAVASISGVSFFCIMILVVLWVRKSRRQRGYEVSNIDDQAIDRFIMDSPGTSRGNNEKNVTLRDVPSIQIEGIERR